MGQREIKDCFLCILADGKNDFCGFYTLAVLYLQSGSSGHILHSPRNRIPSASVITKTRCFAMQGDSILTA